MIMKINQRTIPKTFSVNYGKSNPLNKIKFRNRILSKGSVMFLDNSTQKEEKIKKKIEKENAANEIKIYYSNNNTKLNYLNYRNFSINQYSIHPRKEQKIGEETFKDKLSQFTNSIEFKPFVDHLKFIMKTKETLRPVSKSIKESSSNSVMNFGWLRGARLKMLIKSKLCYALFKKFQVAYNACKSLIIFSANLMACGVFTAETHIICAILLPS